MTNMPHLVRMRSFFESGKTMEYEFRRDQLQKLRNSILKHEELLHQALKDDLNKSFEESWVTETGMVLNEIKFALRNLKRWMRRQKVSTNLLNLPSKSSILYEPLGVVLIIGPWNYPFQLLINPLVGAIAAGNCAVIKPSEFARKTSAVMKMIIEEVFPPEYILYVEGEGRTVIPPMLSEFRFDHIFYTGNTAVGKIIYQEAAKKLVPVTLELGGKSPCVVEEDANVTVAARRICVTKFSNAGQMCVAADYVLVHRSVLDDLVTEMKKAIRNFYSDKPEESYSYGRVINDKQFERLISYLDSVEILHGGSFERSSRYLEPTLVTDPGPDHVLMQEELFGPVLPIIPFDNFEEAKAIIKRNPDPLAFYIFTSDRKKEDLWLKSIASGGACVNNCSWHLTNPKLPFGGRGDSGIGRYHGRFSFETFSHAKAVLKTPAWFDPAIKYPPFKGKLKLFKKVIG